MLHAKLVLLRLESMDCSAAGDWTEPGMGPCLEEHCIYTGSCDKHSSLWINLDSGD